MYYRLGIDLGTNSLGWAAIQLKTDAQERLSPGPLLDMGVRIFSDARSPKDKSSNAAQRREPRSARRNRDRKLSRGRAMLHVLEAAGLMPPGSVARRALERFDPWILRARALEEKLEPFEIGRALFHLQQRRGFKSNRKTDGEDDGAMFDAIAAAREKMHLAGARTLGEVFGRQRLEQNVKNAKKLQGNREPMPQARVRARVEGSKLAYDYYPERAMILDEFGQIWAAQYPHHPELLTQDAHDAIRQVIEHQRPLKPQGAGRCTFLPDEPRAPKALPSAQYARILQEVNNLRVGAVGETSRPLSGEERKALVEFLVRPSSKTAKRTFKSIRKQLGLPDSQKFSLESRKRDHLAGDTTAATLMQDGAWGPAWLDLDRRVQDEIVLQLLEVEQEDDLVAWLTDRHGLGRSPARAASRARLPEAHGKLSKAALDRIIPRMEAGQRYDEAAAEAFRDHRALGDGVVHADALPYYGEVLTRHTAFERDEPQNDEERFGRVANPTVHVALNELRKIINDLIQRWGPPAQIVLELARDLPLSDRGLRELERAQADNQKKNDTLREQLEGLKQVDSYENRLKLRLYEEAVEKFGGTAVCVFSGKAIALSELFTPDIEIEHILPLSRTLDDSFANKVLATREANRIKKNQSPYEAFGASPAGYNWEQIGQRAAELSSSKAWRFAPDAMEQWEARDGDFLARQLNDTRYIARLGKTFVEALYGGQGLEGDARRVWAVPGRLTADLRHFAGFNTLTGLTGGNRKDRTDHRHHGVDALVVALTDQAMVKRAADLSKQEDAAAHHDIMRTMAEPLKRYRASAEDRLAKLIVSHKPDHGFQGAMHNDTALGVTGRRDAKGQMRLVTRKPLDALEPKDLASIIDPIIQKALVAETEGLTGKDFSAALVSAGQAMRPPVRRVRISTSMKDASYIVVQHGPDGRYRKAYKGDANYCYDVFLNETGRWAGQVVSTFEAYSRAQADPDWWRKPAGENGQPVIMRLRKGDMLEIDGPSGERRIVIVYKFSEGRVNMADHYEANASGRIRAKELAGFQMSPSSLQKANAVRLTVSPSGKVKRHKA